MVSTLKRPVRHRLDYEEIVSYGRDGTRLAFGFGSYYQGRDFGAMTLVTITRCDNSSDDDIDREVLRIIRDDFAG